MTDKTTKAIENLRRDAELAASLATLADKLDTVEAEMDAASRKMSEDLRIYTREWYGERCEEYEPDCACCKAWRVVDLFAELNNYD